MTFRIVLMGTGPFAVPSFRAIHQRDPGSIALCITKPNAIDPKRKEQISPVCSWAKERGILLFQPASINHSDAIDRLKEIGADLFVVCDYGHILSAEALQQARLGGINLHGSLLPRHRGAAPVQWSILRGDQATGVSVIHMSPRLDAGPILCRRETPARPHENAAELEERLSELGIEATLEAIDALRGLSDIEQAERLGMAQDNGLSTKARRLHKGDGWLDFDSPVAVIDRVIRGLQPWPGTYGELQLEESKKMRIAILQARPLTSVAKKEAWTPGKLIWGSELQQAPDAELAVVCQDGLLAIESIQPAGKRPMQAREFLMGYQRYEGMSFSNPPQPNGLQLQLVTATSSSLR